MVIDEWQKKYIEAGLFNFETIKNSTLTGDQLMVRAIRKARKFFLNQEQAGDLQVSFIDKFYLKYEQVKHRYKKGIFHKIVCQELGIEQAAGYVVRNEIVLRVALVASSLGLMKFE